MDIPDSIKAAVRMESNQLQVKKMPTPKPGLLEALLKVKAARPAVRRVAHGS